MNIAIIGAGIAGLASLRYSLQKNYKCQVFEQTGLVGGTWNYTDKMRTDEFGLPIHSSMYQGLNTNLPKELMQFEDFPFKKPSQRSYLTQPEVLQYINDYTKHFNLLPHIQFFKNITKVSPLEGGRWTVEIKDLQTNFVESKEFDAIFVCVGNYSLPVTPDFPGLEIFKGSKIHSHNYRKPDAYKNRKVLIVGSGSSGVDIARIVNGVSDNVIISHRSPITVKLQDGIKTKPLIKEFRQNSVIFQDNSEEFIDDVIFCTGYTYNYRFLSKECKIQIENNWIKYLYKQVINVNHPTMAFIGIPFQIPPFVVDGIQIRFFLASLTGTFAKNKEKMTEDALIHKNSTEGLKHPHYVGLAVGEYMDNLAETANIKKVPSVYQKIYRYVKNEGKGKLNLLYKIIDDDSFFVEEI